MADKTKKVVSRDDGTYSICYYRDSKGNPVDASGAAMVEVIDYSKSGDHVNRTYASATPLS